MRNLIILLFVFPFGVSAQNTITGKVTSMVNQKPVPDASVFLSNTSAGTKTADDGSFNLNNVKNGKYDLVVTSIGYETYTQNVTVYDNKLALPTIQLMPKVTELREVKIGRANGKTDARRAWLLRMFTQEFLGKTTNAQASRIVNPQVLDINYDDKMQKLTASSDDFIVIENKALGYRVKYQLNSFVRDPYANVLKYKGVSAFEPMAGAAGQQAKWQKARVKTYLGSAMHFFRACAEGAVTKNDLYVFKLLRYLNPARPADSLIISKVKYFTAINAHDSLVYWSRLYNEPRFNYDVHKSRLFSKDYVKETDQKGIYALWYPGILLVNYKYNVVDMNDQSTFIIFNNEEAYFDSNGSILDMNGNKFERRWSDLRLADLLPADYELPRSLR